MRYMGVRRMVQRTSAPEQRKRQQEDSSRGDVPRQRTDKRHTKGIEWKVQYAACEVETSAPLGYGAILTGENDCERESGEERKRFAEVSKRTSKPTSSTRKRRNRLVPGGSPSNDNHAEYLPNARQEECGRNREGR